MTHHLTWHHAALVSLVLLGGCGKDTPPADAPVATEAITTTVNTPATPASVAVVFASAPTPVTSVAAPAELPFSVTGVTLGTAVDNAHTLSHVGTHFSATEKTVYANVTSTGRSDNVTLNASWRYLEGNGQLVSRISQTIATDGPATTTFMVKNPDLWPEGKYRVDISLGDTPVSHADFEIVKP